MLLTPTALATLPQSSIGAVKDIKASNVHTLAVERGARNDPERPFLKRRQRSEVVVSVPGAGVQIYNVRAAKVVASYVAPSEGAPLCAPTSVLLKPRVPEAGTGPRRLTVIAIHSSSSASGCKLVAWEERIGANVLLKDRIRLREREVDIKKLVAIDITVNAKESVGTEELCIVGIEQDGTLQCWNEELESTARLPSTAAAVTNEAMFLCDLHRARQKLLQGREDIVFAAAAGGMHDLVFSVQTEAQPKDENVAVKIYGIRSRTVTKDTFTPMVQELATMKLPGTTRLSNSDSRYSLHLASGRLFKHTGQNLTIYRLTGAAPRLEQDLSFTKKTSSMFPISSDMVAAASGCSVDIIDTTYKAAVASFSFPPRTLINSKSSTNEVESDQSEHSLIELMLFDPSSSSLTVLRDHRDFASLELEYEEVGQPKKKAKRSTLADAIGRGIQLNSEHPYSELPLNVPRKIGKVEPQNHTERDWTKIAHRLEQAASSRDEITFNQIVQSESEALCEGSGRPNQQLLDVVLTCIFQLKPDSDAGHRNMQLLARLCPLETVVKLASWGYLSDLQVELAHKRRKNMSSHCSLEPRAIIKSLGAYEPSLSVLQKLLQLQLRFSAADLACMTRLGLRRLTQLQNLDQQLLLTGGSSHLPNGNDISSQGSAIQALPNGTSKILSNNVDHAIVNGSGHNPSIGRTGEQSANEDQIVLTERFIEDTLRCLYRVPQSQLEAVLSSELDHSDLLALFYQLRRSIASSGWPLSVTDDLSEPDSLFQGEFENVPFTILSAMLDAFGLHGWVKVTDPANPDEHEEDDEEDDEQDDIEDYATNLLTQMCSDVQIALNNAKDSAMLAGLLDQALLCARRVTQGPNADAPRAEGLRLMPQDGQDEAQASKQKRRKGPVKPMLIAEKEESGLTSRNALPLGSRFRASGWVDPVDLRKFMRTKKTDKLSSREMGHMKSMNVAEHTLEQIRF